MRRKRCGGGSVSAATDGRGRAPELVRSDVVDLVGGTPMVRFGGGSDAEAARPPSLFPLNPPMPRWTTRSLSTLI
jgi:hypothetical protein